MNSKHRFPMFALMIALALMAMPTFADAPLDTSPTSKSMTLADNCPDAHVLQQVAAGINQPPVALTGMKNTAANFQSNEATVNSAVMYPVQRVAETDVVQTNEMVVNNGANDIISDVAPLDGNSSGNFTDTFSANNFIQSANESSVAIDVKKTETTAAMSWKNRQF